MPLTVFERALIAVVGSFAGSLVSAQPLTTAFTYQGELRSAGVPAAGTFDLRFRLYDGLLGGTQIGSTLCADNVAVVDGRFSVSIDFGSVFDGQQRFLEIEVRLDTGLGCANPAGFVILGPRQSITAAPNATYAVASGAALDASRLNGQPATFYQNAANLTSGSIPSGRISGTYTNALSLTNGGNVFVGSGSGLTGLNAANISQGVLNASRLPVPMVLSGEVPFPQGLEGIVDVVNTTAGFTTAAVHGRSTSAGEVYGGIFQTSSTGLAAGILGIAEGQSGNTAGGRFVSNADFGSGVQAYGWIGGSFRSTKNDGIGINVDCDPGLARSTGGRFTIYSPSGSGISVQAFSTTGTNYAGVFANESSGGTGIVGEALATSGATVGGNFITASPSGVSLKVESSSTTSGTAASFEARGTGGTSLLATATAATGSSVTGRFINASADGTALSAETTAATGANFAGKFVTASSGAIAVFAANNAGNATNAAIDAQTQSTSSGAIAIRGQVMSSSPGSFSAAVRGISNGSGTTGIGVWGSHAVGGYGVYGTASTGRGVYGVSTAGDGVVGETSGMGASARGVVGVEPSGGAGHAIFASGTFAATGTKSFQIDHPLDPANAFLNHFCVEAPEPFNCYRGSVTLDDRGEASVELPAYFAEINRDPTVSLTAVGTPMPTLHLAGEVVGNSFAIAGGVPGARVHWRVEATRNDAWMRAYGQAHPTEQAKPDVLKGRYHNPELYGATAERAIIKSGAKEQGLADVPAGGAK